MTLNQLKTRAKRLEMMIRKDGRGGYLLTDFNNGLIEGPVELADVEAWILEAEEREVDFNDITR